MCRKVHKVSKHSYIGGIYTQDKKIQRRVNADMLDSLKSTFLLVLLSLSFVSVGSLFDSFMVLNENADCASPVLCCGTLHCHLEEALVALFICLMNTVLKICFSSWNSPFRDGGSSSSHRSRRHRSSRSREDGADRDRDRERKHRHKERHRSRSHSHRRKKKRWRCYTSLVLQISLIWVGFLLSQYTSTTNWTLSVYPLLII